MSTDSIPDELARERRWVTWGYMDRSEKSAKVPSQRINDPSAWLTLEEARDRCSQDATLTGVGFVLGADFIGIDFDDVIDDDGTIHSVVADTIKRLDTYAEVSPSGRGVHLLVRGAIARFRKLGATDALPKREIYDGSPSHARYFTVTGKRMGDANVIASGPNTQIALDMVFAELFADAELGINVPILPPPVTSLTDNAVLTLLRAARNGEKAMQLFRGEWREFDYPSQSEADLAFVRMLRFYTRDRSQLDRLFRASGLMRPKWDEQHGTATYGVLTISKAINRPGAVYRPRTLESPKKFGHWRLWWTFALHGKGEACRDVMEIISSFANKGGRAFPKNSTIAKMLGVTSRYVSDRISTLIEAGVLRRRQEGRYQYVFQLVFDPPASYIDPCEGRTPTFHHKNPTGDSEGRTPTFPEGRTPTFHHNIPVEQSIDTEGGEELANSSFSARPKKRRRHDCHSSARNRQVSWPTIRTCGRSPILGFRSEGCDERSGC